MGNPSLRWRRGWTYGGNDMRFKEWLKERVKNEVSTTTADVAAFPRRVGKLVRRIKPEDSKGKKNENNKQI